MLITNPVIISVVVMLLLCLFKMDIIMSIIVATVVGGLTAGMPMSEIMSCFIGGMGGNSETALSYVLLGAMVAAIHSTGVDKILCRNMANLVKGKKSIVLWLLVAMACISGTILPVHIAFIPIIIPAMLPLMNELHLDRRAAACALAFGLKCPYLTIPIGYGLIFHNIIRDNMILNGMPITTDMVWRVNWLAGIGMIIGLILSMIIFSKPREYKTITLSTEIKEKLEGDSKKQDRVAAFTLVAGIVTLIVQLKTASMPLGAITGLIVMLFTGIIKWKDMNYYLLEGVKLMGYIAIVMLVAAGYGQLIRETGGVSILVETATSMLGGSKIFGSIMMLLVGLLVTMGIGTSFGTVPVIAAIYVPFCKAMGFSVPATILLIAVAGVMGDAGSPASDTALGPTSGLNADGQHDHIWDTCVPSFLLYNIPLFIFGFIGSLIF